MQPRVDYARILCAKMEWTEMLAVVKASVDAMKMQEYYTQDGPSWTTDYPDRGRLELMLADLRLFFKPSLIREGYVEFRGSGWKLLMLSRTNETKTTVIKLFPPPQMTATVIKMLKHHILP